jgi:hypothetical protein
MSGQIKLKAASLGGDITLTPTDTASNIVVTIPAVTATMLNDQSNIEAQSKTALNASGSAPIYACRAWVNFNGTSTPAIRASGNVSSITDNGTGDYTVNFTTAMSDANYVVLALSSSVTSGGTNRLVSEQPDGLTPRSTTQIRVGVGVGGTATLIDSDFVNVAIFR